MKPTTLDFDSLLRVNSPIQSNNLPVLGGGDASCHCPCSVPMIGYLKVGLGRTPDWHTISERGNKGENIDHIKAEGGYILQDESSLER